MGKKVYLKDLNNWLLNSLKNKKKLKIIKLRKDNKNSSFYLNNSKIRRKINFNIKITQLKKECISVSKKLFN